MWSNKVLCFSLIVAVTFANENAKNHVASIYKKCQEEVKLSNEEMQGFRSMGIPKSQNEKCMMGCLMKEVNVINNKKFSIEGASKIAEKYYGSNQQLMQKARGIIETCAKKSESASDECSVAGIVTTCIVEEAARAGLSGGPGNSST
ncbi:uncharacterized protein LOC126909674 [Daktulosphaira vitifoliae]|uniref:uncharacterized protein LOC126909674 n=1 Tax=Daktulosphaira vitifoliae TaxID=58002 RepID=UPI0021AAB874|nr:uncharacterized protein LOC126909674 [Daktulosphaira vitifoliae]